MGLKRLTGLILMKWAVRDAVSQLLGLWYFGEIQDHYSFFKLFVRLKMMPFSVVFPWTSGFGKDISGFLFTWFLVDTLVSFAFSLAPWISLEDPRRTGREIIREGCYLLSTMLSEAIQIKCYEAILGGYFATRVLTFIGRELFANVVQAALEVYFMVAWLIFYFVVRCREANAEGRRYGRRELEVLINGPR
ncbi:isocitrate dehydrogenase family protein [Hibiscus syriacus]|uniref:Isocitrate dehydrogenase family protein n=1 Tax=Hibiscus syriacus TaxID=106335 RepID=A0A6A3B2Y6_HIBSY|nr:isocitrate dehydrogenase family protein [Hibiscus syriacus]